MSGQFESLPQFFGKHSHLFRLDTLYAAHAQGVSQDNLAHVVRANDLAETGKIVPLILALQGLNALGGNAQRVRNSQPHPAGAVIDGQDTSRNFHAAIIRGNCILLSKYEHKTMAIKPIVPQQSKPLLPRGTQTRAAPEDG